jgi:anti-sigma factor RsiW
MDCPEAQDVIHAYFDGELDLVKTLEFERHIHDCQNCSRAHKALVATRSSLRGAGLYFKAPLGLEERIRADIRKARGEPERRPVSFTWRWMAMAASVAFIAVALWAMLHAPGVSQEKQWAQEVRSSHVRSLMGTHLVDVESSDQHTVKPWFDGRLDFAPDVRDFKAQSFPLVGGRLDYLADRPVAALVYRHDKHFINLFIWPTPNEADRSETESAEQGYSVIHWIRGGMIYWAISDMSDQTLRRFADLYRDQRATTTMP